MDYKFVKKTIDVENATIIWKNFAGKPDKYNAAGGKRTFTVLFDEAFGQQLAEDGWNIGFLEPREPGDPTKAKLQVQVSFKNIPPRVVLISGDKQENLDEDTVSMLDWIEIENVDVIIQPYNWVMNEGTKNEKRGVSAYLKAIYVTSVVDTFAAKYGEVRSRDNI